MHSTTNLVRSAGLALAVLSLTAMPAWAQGPESCEETAPYVFFLFDTSGSMNWSPTCDASQLAAGDCGWLCPNGDCWLPLDGDDPNSRFVQAKEALFLTLEDHPDVLYGFGSFNQDALRVRAKHWLYVATENGPTIPGWAEFPSAGDQEVLGALWACDNGSGDYRIGCSVQYPADLTDPWEVARMRQLPKVGEWGGQQVTFYVRHANVRYRLRYSPATGVPGDVVIVNVRLDRCNNSTCSSTSFMGQEQVPYWPISEFVSWELTPDRSEPLGYFTSSAGSDAIAVNTCDGWDPNTDLGTDHYAGYSLRWPTSSHPLGSPFSMGDVVPFDWTVDQRQEIQGRLAPNLNVGELTPDFTISRYLADHPQSGENFLRLEDESARPLIAVGSTPHGGALHDFRNWWYSWSYLAQLEDPEWECRAHHLIVLTDGDETCVSPEPCAMAGSLATEGVQTWVVAFGTQPTPGSRLECMAGNGGTSSPYYPETKGELLDTLDAILDSIENP